jgi:cytoskeleton protein RodZ
VSEDSQTQDETEQTAQPLAVRAFPGKLLRNLRESSQLTVGDVAQALKFSPRQIDALERDDFAALPGPTFVRGFIRSYAKWLKADPAPLLLMLEDETPVPATEILAPEHMGAAMPRPRGQGKRLPIVAGLLLVAALAIAFQYNQSGHWPVFSLPAMSSKPAAPVAAIAPVVALPVQDLPAPVVVPAEAVQPAAAVMAPVTAPVIDQPSVAIIPAAPERKAAPVPAAASIAPAASSAAANPSLPPSQSPASTPAPPSGHQLVFSFAGKSWVEVKDANGHVVLAQVNAPGTRQVVGGKPPFQIVIGNATQVSLQMDERAIDLVPYIRAEVARLTVE